MSEMFKNHITASVIVYPTVSAAAGISGSAGVGVGEYREAFVKATFHKLEDEKGEGVVTLTVYENTQSAWAGASKVTVSESTGSLTSVSDIFLQSNIRTAQLSVNETTGRKYINAFLSTPTASLVSCEIYRCNPRYRAQDS